MEDNKSFEELEKDFTAIRDENRKCANTAFRIGSALLSLLALSKKTLLQNKEFSEGVTFIKGIVAKGVSYFKGIVNEGDITNDGTITTKNLNVTNKATFFELEIQKAKAAGGMSVNSAGTFHIDAVEETPDGFVCYQRAEKDGVTLLQTCEPKDQMMCSNGMNSLPLQPPPTPPKEGGSQGRGAQTNDGKPHAIGNHYYWRLVTDAPTKVVTHTIDGKEEKCLKLVLSKTDHSDNTVDIPKVGDDLVQIGNRDNKERQSVMMSCAYNSFDPELKPSYWAHYVGVNDYDISKHRYTWFAANGSQVTGNFKVQSDNGGLESIEDYVKGLATNTVVYKMSISPSLYYINADGTAASQVVNISAYKIQGDKMTQLQDSDKVQVYVSLGVFEKSDHGSLTGSGGSWRYSPNAEDGMEERILELYVGGKMVDRQVVNAVKGGEKGKDAITYKLIPMSENVLAYFTEVDENNSENTENAGEKKIKRKMVDVRLVYKIQKAVGEQVNFTTLEAEGMTLTIQPSVNNSETFNYDYNIDAYRLSASITYKEIPDNSYTVTLKKGSDIVDQRIVPITMKPKVVFDIDTDNGSLTSQIEAVNGKMTKIEQTAEHINLTVDGGIRPNLLWGSDLDLSEMQDKIQLAYEQGTDIKQKTAEKENLQRQLDATPTNDTAKRNDLQKKINTCDNGINTARNKVSECKAAIQKYLGVGLSATRVDSTEWFEYLKGGGVGGADAIKAKVAAVNGEGNYYAGLYWQTGFGAKQHIKVKPNTKYTYSFWLKTEILQGSGYVVVESFNMESLTGGRKGRTMPWTSVPVKNTWERMSYTFTTGDTGYIMVGVGLSGEDDFSGLIYLCRPKLEEGNTATPWCAYDGTVDALLAGGFDIKEKKFTVTSDNFVVQNNRGEQTFLIDENGKINNGMLSLDGLDAKRAVIKNLRFQSNSVAPYFVTEESMEEFTAYCTRRYAGWNHDLLFPFDIATFFVFLVKPRWYARISQGKGRKFSLINRDIAVSESMAHSFVVDYYHFAFELFWHNMVGKTVTIANSTNEKIEFGAKLKTKILTGDGKRIMQIGGRLDNLPDFPISCVESVDLLPGQMASFKYTLLSGAPTYVSQPEAQTEGYFLLQDLFDFSYYKKLFEVGYYTEQGFNLFDKKYLDLFNTDEERVEPKGGFPKTKR